MLSRLVSPALQSVPLLDLSAQRYEIDQFQEVQEACHADAAKKFETIVLKVLLALPRRCPSR